MNFLFFSGELAKAPMQELLKTAFDIYKKDTIAAEAKVEMEEIPVKIQCQLTKLCQSCYLFLFFERRSRISPEV